MRGARRTLKGAAGHGAQLHLAVRDVPAGLTMKNALKDAAVRGFLLQRFGKAKVTVTEDATTLLSKKPKRDHPALVLRAEGPAPGLDGKGTKDCHGILVVTLARGRLYLLRLYAFPRSGDPDGVVYDIDYLEGTALAFLDTTKRVEPAPKLEKPKPKPEPISGAPQSWRMVKHAKLTRIELRPMEQREFKVLKLEASDPRSAYIVELYEQPNVRIVGGVRTPATEIRDWISSAWWAPFAKLYRRSEVHTLKWPKTLGVKYPTFLTLPVIGDPTQRIAVAGARKRPRSMDNDSMRRAKCIEKITRRQIGKKGKVKAAWRGCLQATDEKQRLVTELRFGWRTDSHTYLLFVTLRGDAHVKWGTALRETLESIEFGVR